MKGLYLICCLAYLCGATQLSAQDDPEFQKGFSHFMTLHSGLSSAPGADLYVGGLSLNPQLTVVEHKLRAGLILGGVYTQKKIQGMIGVNASIKLASMTFSEELGASGNINLFVRHQWGTRSQKLIGGGLQLELLDWVGLSFSVDRDYHFDSWWYSVGAAYQLRVKSSSASTFNH